MSITIKPYKIFDVQNILLGVRDPLTLLDVSWPDFDSTAHAGDADFAVSVDFESHPDCSNTPDDIYVRPCCFEDAQNWVLDTHVVAKQDKPRLLDLLNALQNDPSLYIHFTS